MPDDHEQIVVRRRKLARPARSRGQPPIRTTSALTRAPLRCTPASAGSTTLRSPMRRPCAIAGRIVALRDFGKAGFLQVQDRGGGLQVYARRDVLGEDAFAALSRTRRGRHRSASSARPFRTRTRELHARRRRAPAPGEGAATAAREVARAAGRRGALPPALRRPDRQPRRAAHLRDAHARSSATCATSSRRAGSSRSRRR